MYPRIIALCGRRRCGKDTVADFLCSEYGYEKLRLADPLKHAVAALFGFDPEALEDHRKDEVDEKWGISPRQAMQWLGTEVMQHSIQKLLPDIGRRFFVESLTKQLTVYNNTNIVIPDMRFLHEQEVLKKHGITIWTVHRPLTHPSTSIDAHISEQEWDKIRPHGNLYNTSTLDALYEQVRELITHRPM